MKFCTDIRDLYEYYWPISFHDVDICGFEWNVSTTIRLIVMTTINSSAPEDGLFYRTRREGNNCLKKRVNVLLKDIWAVQIRF